MEEKRRSIAWQVFLGLALFFIVLPIATCAMCTGGGIAVLKFGGRPTDESCARAWREAQTIGQAGATFQTDNGGDCPKSLDDLVTGKYLSKRPVDPWGQPYRFECTEALRAWSMGRDGVDGTSDDVRGWVPEKEACAAQ